MTSQFTSDDDIVDSIQDIHSNTDCAVKADKKCYRILEKRDHKLVFEVKIQLLKLLWLRKCYFPHWQTCR